MFDQEGVRFALEVHPTEIAYDFVTARAALDAIDNREGFGINLDPSHFVHQFLDTAQFALEFADRIYHVHVKDSRRRLDGRRSILGSHVNFGDERRGWDFVSPGHGDVDFEDFFRALNSHRLRRAALDRVGGLGDGPRVGRAGRARLRPPHGLRPVQRRVRRRDAAGVGMSDQETGFQTMGRASGGGDIRRSASACSATRSWGRRTRTPTRRSPTWPGRRRACRGSWRSRAATRRPSAPRRERFGFERAVTDWQEIVSDPEVELFDNSGPNNMHGEPTVAAAEAGKHVVCEKPLGRDAAESYEIWQRVEKAGVVHMCAFNYRFVPAVRLARQLIEAGELGEIHHFRGSYLQEWGTTDAEAWRFDKSLAGSGSLGDLGAHVIDLSRYLVGEIEAVAALTATFKPGRSVDDAFEAAVRFENGAVGTMEATRFASGRKNAFCWEINGSKGSLAVRPRAAERAADQRRDERLQDAARLRGRRPVLGVVVAARPHARLGAQLRPRALPRHRRDRRQHEGGSARRDLRGRVPRSRGMRRRAAVGRVGAAGDDRVPQLTETAAGPALGPARCARRNLAHDRVAHVPRALPQSPQRPLADASIDISGAPP